MRTFYILLLVAGLFASGCDMLHVKRYEVSGVTANSTDAVKLRAVLHTVAEKSGLRDSHLLLGKFVTNSPDCLFFYTGGKGNEVLLEARYYHNSVLVQLVGGYGMPPEYRQAKQLLTPALSEEFGSRLSIPQPIQTP